MKKKLFGLLIFTVIVFMSCDTGTGNSELDPPIIPWAWETVNGWTRFQTSDPDDYLDSFILTLDATNNQFPVELKVNKVSGAFNYGYGLYFCLQNDGSRYKLLISAGGSYRLSSFNGVSWTTVVDWTNSGYIISQLNKVNTIRIEYNGSETYSVSFNGTQQFSFDRTAVSTGADLTGGKVSFFASVGSEADEDFPAIPVDIRYQLTSPVSFP